MNAHKTAPICLYTAFRTLCTKVWSLNINNINWFPIFRPHRTCHDWCALRCRANRLRRAVECLDQDVCCGRCYNNAMFDLRSTLRILAVLAHLLSLHLKIVFQISPSLFRDIQEIQSSWNMLTPGSVCLEHHSWHTRFHVESPVAAQAALAPGISLPFSYEGLQRLSGS